MTTAADTTAEEGPLDLARAERGPGFLVTPWDVLQWVYCPRYIYYQRCLVVPQYEENRFKVRRGREVHEQRERRPAGSRRERLGGTVYGTEVLLESPRLGLRGKVDEVIELDDGTSAPIDFKYTEARSFVYRTHRIQLCLYAILLEDVLEVCVARGWVAYVRGGNDFHEVHMDERLRDDARAALAATVHIIDSCEYPEPTRTRKKCPDCPYRKLCPEGP